MHTEETRKIKTGSSTSPGASRAFLDDLQNGFLVEDVLLYSALLGMCQCCLPSTNVSSFSLNKTSLYECVMCWEHVRAVLYVHVS